MGFFVLFISQIFFQCRFVDGMVTLIPFVIICTKINFVKSGCSVSHCRVLVTRNICSKSDQTCDRQLFRIQHLLSTIFRIVETDRNCSLILIVKEKCEENEK